MSSSDLRAQVLDASVTLIAEQGLGGLSMREVARRAGVSHQAPYHHFADKAAIVAALVERGFERFADRLEAAAKLGTPKQRLERVGNAYVAFALDEPVFFRLMFRPELTDIARFPAAGEAGARAFAVLQRLVDEEAGSRVRPPTKEAMVSMHWALVHGLATLLLDGPLGEHFPDAASRERHVAKVLRLFSDR